VVTADHGAMAEAVTDGVTGLLFRAGDSASLADALRTLADAPELRRRLAGRPEWVRDEAETASELRGVYARLVERAAGGPQ
jgi:glycosyltransferase involved in cell wall biosynthesis